MHRSFRTVAAVLAAGVALLPGAASAAAHSPAALSKWKSKGPLGANVVAFAVDPDVQTTVLAGAVDGGGAYLSKSGGAFKKVKLADGSVTAIVYNPLNSKEIYAGTSDDGVFVSTKGGKKWSHLAGSGTASVTGLAIDPTNPAVLYASTSAGVLKSTDAGDTWVSKNSGLTDTNVLAIALDAVQPGTLYVGTKTGGVFRTTNSAGSWAAATTGITGGIDTIAVNPSAHTTLFAGGDTGLYRTTSSGSAWTNVLATPKALSVAYDPSDGTLQTLYASAALAGVQKTIDGGTTWTPVNSSGLPQQVSSIALDPSGFAYAGTPDGVFTSGDGGATWSARSVVASQLVRAVATVAASTTVLAGGDGGVAVSSNGGGSWSNTASLGQGLLATPVASVAVDPSNASDVYAGAASGGTFAAGVFASTDAGATWTGLANSPAGGADALAVDGSGVIWAGGPDGVSVSADGGATWGPSGSGLPGTIDVVALVFDPNVPGTVYAADALGGGVFVSTDSGVTWNAAADSGLTSTDLTSLVLSGTTLVAGTGSGGVFQSADGAATWTPASAGPSDPDVQALAVDPTTPATLLAGTASAGVFVSTDGGSTWSSSISGLKALDVLGVAIDQTGRAYAATTNGVYVATGA
jgi:photosystem II stability/assembly factor-like uncharacterized protein